MSRSPMNVSDTNDGQTRVMGWEGRWGWRKEGRRLEVWVPLGSPQGTWGLSGTISLPCCPLGTCWALCNDRLETPRLTRG